MQANVNAESRCSLLAPSPSGKSNTSVHSPSLTISHWSVLGFLAPYKIQIFAAFFLILLTSLSALTLPLAFKNLIDQGLALNDPGARTTELKKHFLIVFGIGTALALFSAVRFYAVNWISERVVTDLRGAVYSHVVRQSPDFFESTQTGEVLSRLTADTTVVQFAMGASISVGLRCLVTALGAMLMLVSLEPRIILPVFVILLLIVAPVIILGRRVRWLSRASQDRVADSSAIAAEVLNAITVVQSYTQESAEVQRFEHASERAFETACSRMRMRSTMISLVMTATFGALLFGLYHGAQAVIRGEISAGHLGQVLVYIILLVNSASMLSEVWGDVLRATGAIERLMELLHRHSNIQDPISTESLPKREGGVELEIEKIDFYYPSRQDCPALKNLSLRVRPGETIALVGASGAGKSTIFHLLQRFYEPEHGSIRLNGIPINRLRLEVLRQHIGLVPQDSVIFSASAMENIRYGSPEASDAQVIAAARAAFAHDFIEQLPQGYQTFLGERGVRLSGGQRQRICIARAIVKNPSLLLLDEATSALDSESERLVQAALEAAMRQRTTLIIAHRLCTVQRADRIAVLDQGRIVEQGTHAELIAANGAYSRLATMQPAYRTV